VVKGLCVAVGAKLVILLSDQPAVCMLVLHFVDVDGQGIGIGGVTWCHAIMHDICGWVLCTGKSWAAVLVFGMCCEGIAFDLDNSLLLHVWDAAVKCSKVIIDTAVGLV